MKLQKKIEQVSKRLGKKYNKKRWVNEKGMLNEKTPLQKGLSIFANVIFWVLLTICILLCLTTVIPRANGILPNFLGYNHIEITTPSMTASGFNIGDNLVIRAVNTDSLKPGDKIAFFVYAESVRQYNTLNKTRVNTFSEDKEYKINIRQMFGYEIKEKKQAYKAKSSIVFHEIVAVYEDENGNRWFKTRGTSNGNSVDDWAINEKLVIGAYDDGFVSTTLSKVLTFLASNTGLIMIVYLPQLLIFLLALKMAIKNVQLAFIELDVVEEKRKLTDKICIKNGIGFNMSGKTKLKVLAQAEDDEKVKYMSLLWRKGEAPVNIQKYLIRKSIILRQMKRMLNLNRECERRFARGDKPTLVAQFYQFEKQKIEGETARYQRLLKQIHNKYKKQENS